MKRLDPTPRLAAIAIGLAVALLVLGARTGEDPRLATGRALYDRHCAECHGNTGRGDGPSAALLTKRPADLRDAELWARYPVAEIGLFVRDGRRLRLELRPDAMRREAARTEALYEFVKKLPTIEPEAVEEGEAIYVERCVPCHDTRGRPAATVPAGVGRPRDLSDPKLQSRIDDATLVRLLRHGKGGMPALVPRVSAADARKLLPFVRLFSPGYEIYDRFCLACHGPYGRGATGPLDDFLGPKVAFDEAYFKRHDPDEVRAAIWHMLRDKNVWMPHFAGVLTDDEIDRIVRYLRDEAQRSPE